MVNKKIKLLAGLIPMLLFSIGSLLLAPKAYAATVAAASCSNTSVQSAIDSAASGDTVTIPAGNCTWTGSISISKAITLQGTGIGSTNITDASSGTPIVINPGTGRFIRLTAFTLDANSNGHGGTDAAINVEGTSAVSSTAYNSFRIDHIEIKNITGRGVTQHSNAYFLSGLIDHMTFDCPFQTLNGGPGHCQSVTIVGASPQVSTHMGRAYAPGTNEPTYIEDSTFNYAYQQDGGVEGYGGAWYVLRRNVMHGVKQGSHGADSGNYRGTQYVEFYQNTFDHQGWLQGGTETQAAYRSGVGFEWGNTIDASAYTSGSARFDNYRSRGTYGVWGSCSTAYDAAGGTYAWDANQGTGNESAGYPCLDEIGHMFTNVLDGSNTLYGWYSFLNRRGGVQQDRAPVSGSQYDIVENREYYDENPSFTGATGIGVGVIASRPATCTKGVGYWATDQGNWDSTNGATPDGEMYKCTATNTWTLTYVPYTYPHPLQATGGGSNPTPIVGDINLDHIVNAIDYSILNSHWFGSDASSDLNNDGIVNAIDYSLLNSNWFKTW